MHRAGPLQQDRQLHQRPLLGVEHGSGTSRDLRLCLSDPRDLVVDLAQQPAEFGELRTQVLQSADQRRPHLGRRTPGRSSPRSPSTPPSTASTPCSTPATSARSPAAIGEEDPRASLELSGERLLQARAGLLHQNPLRLRSRSQARPTASASRPPPTPPTCANAAVNATEPTAAPPASSGHAIGADAAAAIAAAAASGPTHRWVVDQIAAAATAFRTLSWAAVTTPADIDVPVPADESADDMDTAIPGPPGALFVRSQSHYSVASPDHAPARDSRRPTNPAPQSPSQAEPPNRTANRHAGQPVKRSTVMDNLNRRQLAVSRIT